MINEVEIAEEIVFDRAALKSRADYWMAQVDNPQANDWTVQLSDDVIRLWTRKQGLPSAPDVPLV